MIGGEFPDWLDSIFAATPQQKIHAARSLAATQAAARGDLEAARKLRCAAGLMEAAQRYFRSTAKAAK